MKTLFFTHYGQQGASSRMRCFQFLPSQFTLFEIYIAAGARQASRTRLMRQCDALLLVTGSRVSYTTRELFVYIATMLSDGIQKAYLW